MIRVIHPRTGEVFKLVKVVEEGCHGCVASNDRALCDAIEAPCSHPIVEGLTYIFLPATPENIARAVADRMDYTQ